MTSIFPKLTEREKEVLNLIIQGYSNKEICEKLIIAPTTLKCHIAALYQKHFICRTDYTNAEMRLKLALNYLKKIITDIKAQNNRLIEQNKNCSTITLSRKIISQDIEKFQEIEELCKLAKYKGGDDIYYDDILDVVQKWIYSEAE